MISSAQIRAARSFLGLDQGALAEAVGVSKANISEIENDKAVPKSSTLLSIQKYFEMKGVEFRDGGVVPAHKIIQVFEGKNAYLHLLDDILSNPGRDRTILKSNVDERRSSPEVVQKNRELRAAGIAMKNLIEAGNTYLLGKPDEYRHTPAALFSPGDVKIIYGNRVAYLVSWKDVPAVIIIHDANIAAEQTRLFEYVWTQSDAANQSTAPVRYEEE